MSDIYKSFGFLTGKVEQLLEADFAEKLKPYCINARQFAVLIKVKERPNTSQKEIGEDLRIDRTSMVEHIDKLESLQYIQRLKNIKDRRAYCLSLTEKGNEILNECWGLLDLSESNVLSVLEDEEKNMFKKHLIKILNRNGEE